jgi:hypothetical protein
MIVLPHALEPGEYLVSLAIEVSGLTATAPTGPRDINDSWAHLINLIVRTHTKVEDTIAEQIKALLPIIEASIRNNDVRDKGTVSITAYAIRAVEENEDAMRTFVEYERLGKITEEEGPIYEAATSRMINALARKYTPVLAFSTDFDPAQGFPPPQAFLQRLAGLWGQGKSLL